MAVLMRIVVLHAAIKIVKIGGMRVVGGKGAEGVGQRVGKQRAGNRLRRLAAVLIVAMAGAAAAGGAFAQEKAKAGAKPPAPAAGSPPAGAPAAGSPAAGSPAVGVPEPAKAAAPAPAWIVACVAAGRSAPLDCRMEQRLLAQETGRIISIATISIPGATRQPVLQMHLPVGLALQEGAFLKIDDGAETALQWQFCDVNGCYATLPLTSALVDTMKKGRTMTVRTITANRQQLVFNHVLTDFTVAYQAAQ